MKKIRRALLATGLLAMSMTAASPANAWFIRYHYDIDYNFLGTIFHCDDGQVAYAGWTPPPFTIYWDDPQPWGASGIYC